jgi:hypothetical protein
MEVESLVSPDQVLNGLDEVTSKKNLIRVLGANRFFVKLGDWRRIDLARRPSPTRTFLAGGWRSGSHLWLLAIPWGL